MAQPVKNPEPPTAEKNSFGKVAVELGYVTAAQVEEAIKEQHTCALAGLRKRLGEILIDKGYLTPEQLIKVQKGQKSGKRIGDYELISKLGEGGMGSVFKARQMSMDRVVALKILSPKVAKNADFRDRFEREARAVAKLNHPHIISGIDVGTADGYWYFAMECIDGPSMGEYMHRMGGKLTEPVALEFARQIASALQHAHENNILHRDVKPDNILLDQRFMTAKLVDLGLARSVVDEGQDAGLTQAGQCVGTPFYIAPEQARGLADLTAATDLYSLGATIFHALTGKVPFEGATAAVIMTKHLTDPAPSARQVNPDVSSDTDKVIRKLMEKKPENRYESARDLIADIEKIQSGEKIETNKVKGKAKTFSERGRADELRPSSSSRNKDKTPKPKPPSDDYELSDSENENEEREDENSGTAIRSRARRRRRGGRTNVSTGLGTAILVICALAALLVIVQSQKADPMHAHPPIVQTPPKPLETRKIDTPAADEDSSDTPPAAAVPAALEPSENGGRILKTEASLDHFDVDPQFGMAKHFLSVVSDPDLNKEVLKFARIRSRDSACMARLLLPADLILSRGAKLSFLIHFGAYEDNKPEVQVWWENLVDGSPRKLCKWKFKDPTVKSGWHKFDLALNAAPNVLPSREAPGEPQFISFFAGKADENVKVYIDAITLIDPPAAAGAAPANAAEQNTPEKEAPVAPAPKKEPPVAPPPGKKNATDALREAL